jgi:hypothetical protein
MKPHKRIEKHYIIEQMAEPFDSVDVADVAEVTEVSDGVGATPSVAGAASG